MIGAKTIFIAGLMAAMPLAAQAQTSNFARDRNTSVLERPRPDFEAAGVRAGAFMVYPRLSAELEVNDNIFAEATGEDDDTVYRIKPQVAVQSNWSRHQVGANARASFNRYADFGNEDTDEYGAGLNARLDVARSTRVTGGIDVSRNTEPRTSPNTPFSASSPVEFDQARGNLDLSHEFNRLRLTLGATVNDLNYKNTTTTGGAFLLQDDRDRVTTTQSIKAEYAVSPATAVFVSAIANQRDYDLNTPLAAFNRDSDGYDVTVGVNFDAAALVRGEIELGYLSQSYDSAAFQDIEGLAARARVEWFPTELTTVTFSGSQSVEESTAPGSGGYTSANVGAMVDHELLRNVLLKGGLTFNRDDYEGVDREDKRVIGVLSAAYLVNRRVGLSLAYNYYDQDSSGAASTLDYSVQKITAGVTLQF